MPARGRRPARKQHDDYAEMTGILPGYIKPADVAWFSDHHHNAAGENVPYAYSYLFSYALDLPPGAKSITLPKNSNVRIFAVSVANTNPDLTPVQPLYDTLHRSEPTTIAAAH
jgi:alpha-mannosidase